MNGSTYVNYFFIRQYIGDILFPEVQEEDEAEHDSLPCQSGSLRPLDWIRKSTPSPRRFSLSFSINLVPDGALKIVLSSCFQMYRNYMNGRRKVRLIRRQFL